LCTIHRAENTDHADRLEALCLALQRLDRPVVLPLHPRTRKRMSELRLRMNGNVRVIEPVGYLDMLQLQATSACVLTDSGGMQKEAYYLKVPCITMRDETEWVETVAAGWNALVAADPDAICHAVVTLKPKPESHAPIYGVGDTAARIVEILIASLKNGSKCAESLASLI
jgi:UDP-GlcNAc3NAcA epimerase